MSDKLSAITYGAAVAYVKKNSGSSTMLVKTVASGDTFPTTRPNGSALILGDFVKPKSNATFPFTISGITFNTINDMAVWTGTEWLYNANPFQRTNETPLANKTTESLSGASDYQNQVNIENKAKFEEIDEDLDKKVDKLTGTYTKEQVYKHNPDGTEGSIGVGTGANELVKRNANGQVEVPTTPQEDTDATSKSFVNTTVNAHVNRKDNPHEVTKAQVGLGNCDNTADLDKPISTATQAAIDAHTNNKSNPHEVTKAQLVLENVDNTSDLNKPISTATQTALDLKTDKVTGNKKVYTTNDSGQQSSLGYSEDADANTIIKRDASARAKVEKPTSEKEIANKEFVDEEVAKKTNVVGKETGTSTSDIKYLGIDNVEKRIVDSTAIHPEDVKDNLTSSDTNKPLSANQGRILKGLVDHRLLQVTTMPTASADYLDVILQFVGTTAGDYINGYFYKCVEVTPATTPATYHFVNVQVQTGGGGGGADIDNKSIILDSNNKARTSVYAYDNRKTETILIGECTGVNYLAENIKEFTSTTPAQISTFAVGDRIVGTYSILRIGQFGFDKIAQAVTITKYGSTETINMIGVEAIDNLYFGVYNDGTNDHLIVADTANSISSLTCIMENTNRVSGELKTIERKFFNQTMAFRGYIGETEPEGDIWPEEGDFWCKTQVMPSETPLNVYRYTNNRWTEETEEYYPGVFEIWSDINLYPYKDYYWNGYEWIIISSDTTQVDNISIEKNDGILAIKQAGVNTARLQNGCVTKEKISSDAYVIFREDVINNLTSTSVYKPLAAYQGKVLNEIIGSLSSLTTTVKTSIVNAINELVSIKVNIADIVDNLTSTDTNKPLSAKQGKVLNEKTTKIWKQSSEPTDAVVGDLWIDDEDVIGDYLEKSGGILTGNLNVGDSTTSLELKLNGNKVSAPKTTTTAVSFTPTTGITGGVDVQRNYEYDDHYEYNFIMRLSNIPVQASQIPLGTLNGIQGTNFFSHIPVPIWYEQGIPSGMGLIYYGGSYNLYVNGNTVNGNTVTFNCRLITLK